MQIPDQVRLRRELIDRSAAAPGDSLTNRRRIDG
jgi:hypothetical protein